MFHVTFNLFAHAASTGLLAYPPAAPKILEPTNISCSIVLSFFLTVHYVVYNVWTGIPWRI